MSMLGLGSVSDAVMRNSHSPVLLVRNQADKMAHPVGAQAVSCAVWLPALLACTSCCAEQCRHCLRLKFRLY